MDPIKLSESNYDFSEKFLSIAEKYFSLNDISTLKVGMFGYTTELLALIARDSVFHRNFLYNEFFPNTINLHSSIYNWAKILEEPITTAQPAKILAVFTIQKNTITGNTIRINRKTIFNIDKYKFLLPYDLVININQTSVTAVYDISDGNVNYKDNEIQSPYLKVVVSGNEIQILITLYNLEIEEFIYNILTDDILEKNIFDIKFKNELASFNVLYKENQNDLNYINLPALFNDIQDTATIKNAFYTPLDTDTLRIYFSNKPGFFSPSFNSQVKVEVFNTLGVAGNFKYNGAITMSGSSFTFKYNIIALTDSIGGTSSSSLIDMKKRIINSLRSRKTINTVFDLNNLFNTLKEKSSISGVDIEAYKSRDDFISRNYSIFSLIRDSNNTVIPTNTIDIDFTIDELEDPNVNFTLKPGTVILYDKRAAKYRLLEKGELAEYYINNKNVYMYSVPFLTHIDFKEFPKVNFFNTNYEKDFTLYYDYVKTNSPYEVVINSIKVERNSVINMDYFRISLQINSPNLLIDLDNQLINIKIRLLIKQNNASIGYVDLIRLNNTNTFYIDLPTNDEFNSDGAFLLSNILKDDNGNLISESAIFESLQISVGVLLESTLDLPPELLLEFNNMVDINNYILLAKTSPREDVALVDHINDVMQSPIKINQDTGIIRVTKLPVISSLFNLSNTLSKDISKTIEKILISLRSITNFLDNNTSLNLKFFNSYGVSKLFETDTIDITLDLQMKMKTPITPKLEYDIKKSIIDFIEATNSNVEVRFALSNLFTYLEKTFPEIDYIKFSTLNKTNTQSISKLSNVIINKSYVPEFLTVKKIYGSDIVNTEYTYDINISYT